MYRLPTGRPGQLLALGVTVLLPTALALGVVAPLIGWHGERREALATRQALAGRMEALDSRLPELRKRAAVATATHAGEPALLTGDSDAMAGAVLQDSLRGMFLQAGVSLNSVETLPGEEAGVYRRIRLRIAFNASWPVLAGLLQAIDTASPVLLVDELQLQPAMHRMSTSPGSFDVTCAIFAFRSQSPRIAVR